MVTDCYKDNGMKKLKGRPPLEVAIQNRVRATLTAAGWTSWKTHGGPYQSGWPDLYCAHPQHGARWAEIKRPRLGRFTPAQRVRFAELEAAGVGVWVLHEAAGCEAVLLGPPNWRNWL